MIFLVLSPMGPARGKKTSKKFEKGVDKTGKIVYYLYRRLRDTTCREMETDRGVAQSGSARALGAWGRGFESLHPDQTNYPIRGPVVKRPKTPPFHGGYSGSNPDGVTISSLLGPLAQLVRAAGS